MHPLDRPAWSSLNTVHSALARGDDLAKAYVPDVNLFAATGCESDEAMTAFNRLVQAAAQIYVIQAPAIRIPSGLNVLKSATAVQLVAEHSVDGPADMHDIVPLGEADAEDMLALASLTEPGPFLRNTYRMGEFFGVRIDGRLAAMAGERFRFPGYAEVSGVCTHPDFRNRGLASRLSRYVAARIGARGETAFLHSWASNTSAIALYERLGFGWRSDMNVAVLEPQPG
jgi:predicted GNAT family acetyltransferase